MTETMAIFAVTALLCWIVEIRANRILLKLKDESAEMWKAAYEDVSRELKEIYRKARDCK